METVALMVICCLAVVHAWTCKEAPQHYPAAQIDAGQGQVVMTDKNNQAYFLSGSTWLKLGTVKLQHVSVGPSGIWGVDPSGKVYKYVAGDFVPSEGAALQQVDAGGAGQVVGVSSSSSTFCLKSTLGSSYSKAGNLAWDSLSKTMIYYSCGPLYGCWATDAANLIYVTQKVTPATCKTSGWLTVSGSAKMAEVGTDGNVFVLNSVGRIYQRLGISRRVPQGTDWAHIPMCMTINHISYDLGTLWAVTTGGIIFQCT